MISECEVAQAYSLHGLGLRICSTAQSVATAIDARLRHFRCDETNKPDIVVMIRHAPCRADAALSRPAGSARAVYDAPVGEIVYFSERDQMYLDDGVSVRALADARSGTIEIEMTRNDSRASWVASHPFFTIPLIDLLKRQRRFSLHAGCLSIGDSGVLIAGTSGSGKSTLTLALLRAGFTFLSDDMVFLRHCADQLRAFAFPDEIDVTADTVRFFPELAHLSYARLPEGWPKFQVRAEKIYGAEPAVSCRPRVLILPRVTGERTSHVEPMDKHSALLELAPNILLTDPAASQEHFDALAMLITTCDCYRLQTGTDLDAAAELLRELIDDASS